MLSVPSEINRFNKLTDLKTLIIRNNYYINVRSIVGSSRSNLLIYPNWNFCWPRSLGELILRVD